MDQQSQRIKEFKKFYNAFTYKFKKYNRIELKFLATEILQKKNLELQKTSLLSSLIQQIYSVIDQKDQQEDPFWQLVDYLSDFLKVVKEKTNQKSNFQKITKNGIEIYHKNSPPDLLCSTGNNQKSILKNKVVCLCNKEIRKKYQCFKCEIECHKSCLSWTQGDLICPNCMLQYYDPFLEIKKNIIPAQLLENQFVYKFNLDQSLVKENYFLVIKCLKVDNKINQKYNEFEINFPQKAIVKLNHKTIQTYKPDKSEYIRKKDKPIVINLMQNFNDFLKQGLNIFYCEFDLECEENENIEYIFNIQVCNQLNVEKLVSKKIQEQSKLPNKVQNSKNFIAESFKSMLDPLKMKVALTDPITMKQIKIPVRGDNCKHLNTFCLETYLKNLRSTDFKKMECPCCKRLILDFKIDFYFVDILFEFQSLITNKNLEQEITFLNDLSYKFHEAPPINSQDFSSISHHKSPPKKLNLNKINNHQDQLSQNTEEDLSDENFEIFTSTKRQQKKPQTSFFGKRGRGRPPGSKNKTPEERFKNKMQEMLKQANKMYSFNITHQTSAVLSEEEKKIVEAIKKYTKTENVPSSILLDSYYDTVQLQKRVKNHLMIKEKNLAEDFYQIIQMLNQLTQNKIRNINP